MPSFPSYPSRSTNLLSGLWDFAFTPGGRDLSAINPKMVTFNRRMAVPGCFDACPSWAGQRGTAIYRTQTHIRPGQKSILKFPAVGLFVRVYVDNQMLHEQAAPYSAFEVSVPATPHSLREIVLVVDNRVDTGLVPTVRPGFDFYLHGGVFRGIELHEVPDCYIDRVYVRTLDAAAGLIQCEVMLKGELPEKLNVAYGFDGEDPEPFPEAEVLDGKVLLMLSVPDPSLWTLEDPNLHKLYVSIGKDAIIERFGLRTIECVGDEIHMNGKPLPKLQGVNRHEAHPEYGPALPVVQLLQDAQLLKDLGCNFVRGAHYPQDQRFLDLCDEMGILVYEEVMNWNPRPEDLSNPAYVDAVAEQIGGMVRASQNHPSVIMWGVMAGGASDEENGRTAMRKWINMVREEDLSRPITYATDRLRSDLMLDMVDIISISMYPAWRDIHADSMRPLDELENKLADALDYLKREGHLTKPVLLSEIGAGALYGWRDRMAGMWSEEYQAEYFERACRYIKGEKRFAGVALWQFCDCRAFTKDHSLGRPRGFNNKGLCDEYRRPKLAYFRVRKQFR